MNNRAQILLARLEGVKQTQPNRWICRCPAHQDRSPSLAIRETQDGLILLHCFAGCDTEAILDSLSLSFSDLFPDALTQTAFAPLRLPMSYSDALRLAAHELLTVAIIVEQLEPGSAFSTPALQRLREAGGRIHQIVNAIPA